MKLQYNKDTDTWQIVMWDEYHMHWEILPGVMTIPVAAYTKLVNMQEMRGKTPTGESIEDSNSRIEMKLRERGLWSNPPKSDEGYDFSEEFVREIGREANRIAWESWRDAPSGNQMHSMTQMWGADIFRKWQEGLKEYGPMFQGDPLDHAIKENEDTRVYLRYAQEERKALLDRIDALESRLENQHERFIKILQDNNFDLIDDLLVPSIVSHHKPNDSTEIIFLLQEIRRSGK